MKNSHPALMKEAGRGNHNPVPAMELRAGIEPAAFRLRNGRSAKLSCRSACQPPENVEVSRHSAAVWPDVFSHGTDERQPLWAVPDALSQPGSVGSFRKGNWSRSTDSNREPAAYKAAALPLRYCGLFPPSALSRQDGPCRGCGRRNATAVNGIASETTDTETDAASERPSFSQPWTAGRAFAPFQSVNPAALEGGHFFAREGVSLPPRQTPWNLPQSAAPCAVDGWGTIRQI